ncbi:hypothetical protein GCM10009665_10210 [Kitasatospora nipponensis]|uniref:Uncharacterized protein n=1 Tax=Kitasatospora nipponensis TaxID=258049 RepID=A0ABN1VVU0_9ACTN
MLAEFTAPSFFGLHPPDVFQIDGSFGITAAEPGLTEMLVQSHNGGPGRRPPSGPAFSWWWCSAAGWLVAWWRVVSVGEVAHASCDRGDRSECDDDDLRSEVGSIGSR